MGESAAIRLMRRVRETGGAAPARIGHHRKPLLAGHEALLRELLLSVAIVGSAAVLTWPWNPATRRRHDQNRYDYGCWYPTPPLSAPAT